MGKHSRIRTMPMPTWVKVAIDAWTCAAGIPNGYVFRPVNRADRVVGDRLGEKVVWQLVREYHGIAPCDESHHVTAIERLESLLQIARRRPTAENGRERYQSAPGPSRRSRVKCNR